MSIEDAIKAIQLKLGLVVDGRAGPLTWNAIYVNTVGELPLAIQSEHVLDDRSEKVIANLVPVVQDFARALVQKAAAHGIVIKIISGTRTYAEQDEIYAQGRTAPGKIVTNAKGGHSNHNFGIAFDIGIFDGRRYLESSPLYKVIGALGEGLGLEWGGNWTTIVDEPHFQLRPEWAKKMPESEMLANLRDRKINKIDIYA